MSTVFNFTFVPWFRSVAPYIHMHRGKTFVVGLPGEAIAAGKLPHIAHALDQGQVLGDVRP
jgi:amino-acid N-acetyltransferase